MSIATWWVGVKLLASLFLPLQCRRQAAALQRGWGLGWQPRVRKTKGLCPPGCLCRARAHCPRGWHIAVGEACTVCLTSPHSSVWRAPHSPSPPNQPHTTRRPRLRCWLLGGLCKVYGGHKPLAVSALGWGTNAECRGVFGLCCIATALLSMRVRFTPPTHPPYTQVHQRECHQRERQLVCCEDILSRSSHHHSQPVRRGQGE